MSKFIRRTEVRRFLCSGFKKVFEGELLGCISNQILAELSYVLIEKFNARIEDVNVIVQSLISGTNWTKISYDGQTVVRSLKILKSFTTSFFDVLISETMKENGIFEIYTENEKDFRKISGIKVINPFV